MFERRLRALVVVVGMAAAIIGLMIAPAGASSRVRAHQPPVVRPHFRFVGDAVLLWTGARYALAAPEALPGPPLYSPATLIDDQSGQVKTIAQAGCYPVLGQPSTLEPLDLPWVPFNCGWPGQPVPELYSPATGQWQAVSPSPGAVQSCDSSNCTDDFLAAAGRYWLEYNHAICDSGNQHCSYSNVFQNIPTGELRQDPSAATTMVDLNAPDLTRPVCKPLRVPTIFGPYNAPAPGLLTFYGSFAVSIGGDGNGSEVYLERCGTHLHRLLTTAPLGGLAVVGANTREVVWMAHPPFLSALTLPGLRPFTIRLPNRLVARSCSPEDYSTCVAQIALTNQRLYLLTAGPSPAHLWAAPNPRPAKRRRSARRAGGRAQQSSAHVHHAAWYVGTTSAGTRIDFRTSPSASGCATFTSGLPR
jgi:hypothetical protein